MTAHNNISSNAFNAVSFVSNGVDPRTGQYTVTVNLPELNGNQLCGPALPLGLSFSPINTRDSGYGVGWDLSLTQFNPTTRVLSLASGETYKVTGQGWEPKIAECKLETFKFFDEGAGRYRVVHKNGLVEVLAASGIAGYVLALPVQIQSPEGHSLSLSYEPYGNFQRLREVKQADGRPLLLLRYSSGSLNISYLEGASDRILATYMLMLDTSTSWLKHLILPSGENARWSFDYERIGDYTCLKSLRSPQGAIETNVHGGRHPFPASNKVLPRVTQHVIDPGRGQPVTETRYTYSSNNFLGYNAASLTWRDDGMDNLYRVTEAYEYYSIQTRYKDNVAGRTIKSTYNRYHLLTEQVTTNGNARLINATEYHLDDSLPFDLQMPQCQLPRKTLSRWTLVDDPTSLRDEVETTRFDAFGNKIEHIDPSGVRETWSYYSALGEPGCPPDPYGFCRQAKAHRRYPAKPSAPVAAPLPRLTSARKIPVKRKQSTRVYSDEPVMITAYTYKTHPPLNGGPVTPLVLDTSTTSTETPAGEQVQLQSTYSYYDCPDIPGRHGKPHTTVEEQNGYRSTITHDYDYVTRPGGLTHREQVSHAFDGTTSESLQCFELYTGLLLEEHTLEGRILRNEYDALGRLTSEGVDSADGRYPAVRRYSYSWPTTTGRFAEHRVVDAEGIETIEELDGMGRTIRELQQKADGSSDDDQFRLVYSAQYGHEMQLLEETRHDWLDDQPLATTRRLEYDEWDQERREVDANGIGVNTLVDPFERTVTRWQDGMAKTTTYNNQFGKPESVIIYPPDSEPDAAWVSRERSVYDGYGQVRLKIASNGGRTSHDYDVFGRLTRQQLPDRTRIYKHYAEHSSSALITEIQVSHNHRTTAPSVVASQRFDGLERVVQSTVGSRNTQLRYYGNLDVIDERITPAQQTISYEYDLGLGNEATATHAEESCTFEYHPITAALTKATSPQGTQEYHYDRAGRIILERSEAAGKTREVSYRHSAAGRLLGQIERVGATQLETTIKYDAGGRIQRTVAGQLRTDFEYNPQGQLARTTTQDLYSGNTSVTELEYDALKREILRTQRLSGAEYQTALTWAPDGHLQHRELRTGIAQTLALRESFTYDLRGRLIDYVCIGPDLPQDAYGNSIVCEQFDFDELNNLMFCTRCFGDGSKDEARHFYADDDRCQLRAVTHTHPDYPAETLFSYDADGNLTLDADGRALQYDRQGRLLQVSQADGAPLTRYRYDAHDHLLGVTRSTDAETLRFYQGNKVCSMVEGERVRSFSYADEVPLGEQRVGEPDDTLLTLCGETHTVLAELKGQGQVKRASYTIYGDTPKALDSALAFNGEVREADTGWYLLGKGYRAYDPQLRRFLSPDSASPFGVGGLNSYAYCLGDPVGLRDPSGHFAQPQRELREYNKALAAAAGKNALASLGMGAMFAVLGAVVFAPLTGGLSLASLSVGLAIEMTELSLRTAWLNDIQAKGKSTQAYSIYDNLTLIVGIVGMSASLSQAIPKIGAKLSKRIRMNQLYEQGKNIPRPKTKAPQVSPRSQSIPYAGITRPRPSVKPRSPVNEMMLDPRTGIGSTNVAPNVEPPFRYDDPSGSNIDFASGLSTEFEAGLGQTSQMQSKFKFTGATRDREKRVRSPLSAEQMY